MKHAILAGIAAVAVAATLTGAAFAADISGAGSTFIYPLFAKWADTYKTTTGTGLNYQSIGSGGGIKQVEAKTVTFGATDKPLGDDELTKNGLVQFPMVMGGIVAIVNIDGVKPGDLVLDGPTLAGIFMGKITSWDDAAIKALNPSLTLPTAPIVVAHRSDGSGTTFNFTNYLGKESKDWADTVGSDTAVEWPVGVGAKGSEGVANTVKQTAGSIGYVEYAYAKQNNLSYAKLVNANGKTVDAEPRQLRRCRLERRLRQRQELQPDHDQPAGRRVLADHRLHLGADPCRSPMTPRPPAEALKFFDWAYTEWQGPGQGARLRRDPGCRGCPGREVVGGHHRRRQAGLLRSNRTPTLGAGACRARSFTTIRGAFKWRLRPDHSSRCRWRSAGQGPQRRHPGPLLLLHHARLGRAGRRAAARRHGLAAGRRLAGDHDLRPQLRVDGALEPGQRNLRRAGAHLRHHHHLADRHDHRHPGELRHRDLPHRDLPRAAAPPDRHRHRAARRHSLDHLRPVGLLLPRAVPADDDPAGADRLASARCR